MHAVQRAMPAVLGSTGLAFLVGEVLPATVSRCRTLALAPRSDTEPPGCAAHFATGLACVAAAGDGRAT